MMKRRIRITHGGRMQRRQDGRDREESRLIRDSSDGAGGIPSLHIIIVANSAAHAGLTGAGIRNGRRSAIFRRTRFASQPLRPDRGSSRACGGRLGRRARWQHCRRRHHHHHQHRHNHHRRRRRRASSSRSISQHPVMIIPSAGPQTTTSSPACSSRRQQI